MLTYAGDLWQRTVDEVGADFAGVEVDYVHVDAMCLYLVTVPERFDVVVTDNLFGDIITDLGAAVQGGARPGRQRDHRPDPDVASMFEPVHGSAPDIAGRGWANPAAAVLSAALCLSHLGEVEAAAALEAAAGAILPTLDAMGGPAWARPPDRSATASPRTWRTAWRKEARHDLSATRAWPRVAARDRRARRRRRGAGALQARRRARVTRHRGRCGAVRLPAAHARPVPGRVVEPGRPAGVHAP